MEWKLLATWIERVSAPKQCLEVRSPGFQALVSQREGLAQ